MTKTAKTLTVVVFALPILDFLYFQFFVQAKDSISEVLKMLKRMLHKAS